MTLICHTFYGHAQTPTAYLPFIPKGYSIIETLKGDLNKDGIEDEALLIKRTDKTKFVKNEYGETEDLNRRGLIVIFNHNGLRTLAAKNYQCFGPEDAEGGVYMAPKVALEVKKGKLYVHFTHGRYGINYYTFRYQNDDFEMIGYDEINGGAVIESEVSIDFLSKKKLTKTNINEYAEGGDEIFQKKWETIQIPRLIKLSQIKNFDELDMTKF